MVEALKFPDGYALTELKVNEEACPTCGRAVWNGMHPMVGWVAICGRRVARAIDCGTAIGVCTSKEKKGGR